MLPRALFVLLSVVSSSTFADAYRCIENGRVMISNMPCPASKVVRAEAPTSSAIDQANQENARQRAYLDQRERQHRNDQVAVQRHIAEVDRMYPNRPEPVPPSSSSPTLRGCGFGGSCPSTVTRSR